jgi:hypothetical protein
METKNYLKDFRHQLLDLIEQGNYRMLRRVRTAAIWGRPEAQ